MDKPTIAERYIVEQKLGTGGMGTVYKGTDSQTNQPVAIKQLRSELTDAELIQRFKREGKALRKLNHPNIVKMLDTIEEDGNHYIIMEYVSDGDLRGLIENEQQIPYQKCVDMCIDLADALTRAHRLNIIHRDLKPANVLVADDGVLKLTDFGIAHVIGEERVTETNSLVGTIDYLSPEALGNQNITASADIWAFGVMLFEMLTGTRPFSGDTIAVTLSSILSKATPDIESLLPDLPLDLVDLIYRMLDKNPANRISSIRYVGAILEDILHGQDSRPNEIGRFETPETFTTQQHNLPAQMTAFVGREAELDELNRLISNPQARLMTIVAPGGMGKTRLSLEAATQQIDNFTHGVFFVELAPLTDPQNIPIAIADATSYQFQSDGREQKQQILDFLSNKHLLLVMDNFEHLVEGNTIVTDILNTASNVQILASSRQRLNLSGETVFNLGGMDFPTWETPNDAVEYAAVKLFMQSAKRVQPQFEVTADNMAHIARICKLVQGMPLGILLAASWLMMLSVEEIAEEIVQGIDFLESNITDLPERHRSIRAVFDYSWDLIDENERNAFMKLSIFKGGFTREAAQAVADANLRTLLALTNKSLIKRDADSGRYEVHELLRQYAEGKLEDHQLASAAKQAHAEYYAALTETASPQLRLAKQEYWYAILEDEQDNLRAALTWCIDNNEMVTAMRIAVSLRDFWFYQGYHIEALNWLRKLLPYAEETDLVLRGRLNYTYGIMLWATHELEKAEPYYQKAVDILRQSGNKYYLAWALGLLTGVTGLDAARYEETLNICYEGLALHEEVNDRAGLAQMYNMIGNTYEFAKDYDKAIEAFEKSLKLSLAIGETRRVVLMYGNLAGQELEKGNYDEAFQLQLEGIRIVMKGIKTNYLIAMQFVHAAIILSRLERFQEAGIIYGHYVAQCEMYGFRMQPMHSDIFARFQQELKDGLDMSTYNAMLERGQNMSVAEAAEYVLNIKL